MRSKSRSKFLRVTAPPEPVTVPTDRTENAEAARNMRDWLRDRDDNDVPEWYEDDVIY